MADRLDEWGRARAAIAAGTAPDGKAVVVVGISDRGRHDLGDRNNTYQINLAPFGADVTLIITGCDDYDSFGGMLKRSADFRDIGTEGQAEDRGPGEKA